MKYKIGIRINVYKILLFFLALYFLLIPFDNYRIPVIYISYSNLVICISFFFTAICLMIKKNVPSSLFIRYPFPFFIGCFVICMVTIINIVFRKTPATGLKDIFFILSIWMYFISSSFVLIKYPNALIFILKCLFISVFISALGGYYEIFYYMIHHEYWQEPALMSIGGVQFIRMTGTYFDPNYCSVMPLMGMVLAVVLDFSRKWKLLFFLFFGIAVISTFSRMAFIAVSVFIFVYHIINSNNKQVKYLTILIIFIIGIFTIPYLLQKLFLLNPDSTSQRLDLLKNSITEWLHRPIFGYGFGKQIYIDFEGTQKLYESHNTYLQLLLYGGCVSFISIFFPILFYLKKVYRNNCHDKINVSVRNFIIYFMPPFFVNLFFLNYFNMKYFWIFIFLILQYFYIQTHNKYE